MKQLLSLQDLHHAYILAPILGHPTLTRDN